MSFKNIFILTLIVTFSANGLMAQESMIDEINSEVGELYPKKKSRKYAQNAVESEDISSDQAPVEASSNDMSVTTKKIQTQPATVVEGEPIKESRSEKIRKQREAIERETEDNVIQKIEDDRLNAEKDRQEKFNRFGQEEAKPAQVVPPPAPVASDDEEAVTLSAPLKQEKKSANKFLVGSNLGLGFYSAENISGAYALGLDTALVFPSGLGILASGMYSTYDIKNVSACYYCVGGNTLVKTLKQYNLMAGVTYEILPGETITPVIGGVLSYTRRSYSDRIAYGTSNSSNGSNAFDGGLLAGANVKATKTLIVSAEVRYMINLSYRTDDPLAYGYGYQIGTPIEELNYYFATVGLKLAL